MKQRNFKFVALVLCLLITTLFFPQKALALTAPIAPTSVNATALSSSQISITWDPVGSSTAYYVYRGTSSSGNYSIVGTTTTTNFNDSGLSPGTAYYYKVQAANILGGGAYSNAVYAVTLTSSSTLSAPANLTATAASTSQIYLTWNGVSGASYYYVYRTTANSGTYTLVAQPSTTSFTDIGLSMNITYYYKVQAVCGGGVSGYSAVASATPMNSIGAPAAPTNLIATAPSTTQIKLTWNPVSYATNYYVYRSNSPSGPFSTMAVPDSPYYTDSGLTPNVAYYYKVVAGNSYGTSADSPVVYATTTISNTVPAAPSNLTATAASSTQVYLTWNAASNVNFYYVYRSTSPYGTYAIVGSPTTAYYNDSTVSANTTYYYKVVAVGNAGPSADSAITNATTVASGGLAAPASLTATAIASTQVYLTWAPVTNATYYSVFRSTSLTGTFTVVGVPTTTTYTDNTVSAFTTYYYKVVAVGNSATSPDSAIVNAVTTYSNGALPTPTNLTATPQSTSQIYLTWSAVPNATYYNVYRALSPSVTYTNIGMATSTSLTDSSLTANTTYNYKVVAVGSNGPSADSAVVSATTMLTNSALSTPANPTATALSTSQIYLTWSAVPSAASYNVYRAASLSDTYTSIATVSTLNYTDSNLTPNTTYYYKIQAAGSSGLSSFSSVVSAATTGSGSSTPTNTSQIPSQRLAGTDMYGTAAEVAKEWNTSYFAVIVSGETFSDALCSAPLAEEHNAPLLLTTKNTLNDQTKAQLTRLKVKSVFIVGGVGVISAAVEQSIKDMGIQVTRIAGNDSYETSVKIAQAMNPTSQAVVASGETFPDALSIAPVAAMKEIPILLTSKNTLPQSVKTYLKGIQSTYVVGGTGVISDNVFNQLPSPTRLSGQDRYDTNISVIKAFAGQLDFSKCYISTGENYGDALAGSVLASMSKSPVFLVSNPVEQSTLDYMGSISGSIKNEVVFGGTVAVPDSVLSSLNGSSTTNVSNVSTAISAPRIATASTVSSSQINLSWDAVSGATSYYIFGATSSTGTFTHIATVTTNSYSNTGLWANTTYYYKIQAVNGSAASQFSPVASATTSS
ncbi:cell wall-binding repeat-containing protein [Desulfosporosinus sp. FKA]|uniref:cell wall-binding repeat-containing protein n=1 Tax=Desulfosporosinus sp. FKA TaxID=1969834 RepID=UPI000B49C584|nr:cell wall-binding repeat-containing protein [Desulfosporosinus sp. FKA]